MSGYKKPKTFVKLHTWKVDSILFKIVKVIVVAATVEVINEKKKEIKWTEVKPPLFFER